MKNYYVYILASRRNGTIYTGVTNNLIRRIFAHKQGYGSQFTAKYNVHLLVYYELTHDIRSAIQREKQLKKWVRTKKIKLIESSNPDWKDLFKELC